jgi:hypothetical protein
MPLRQHDVVLADGRFRVVLTDRRRLFAVIEAPDTALGPLYIALEIDRGARNLRRELGSEHTVGGFLDDLGRGASRTANEGAFKTASHLATTLAPPAFGIVRDVAAHATSLLNQHLPLLPDEARKPIESAARIVLRARLGDLSASRFIEGVVGSVRSGAPEARPVGDALVAASRLVTHALTPSTALTVAADSAPFHAFERMTSAFQRGDFRSLARIADDAAGFAARATETLDDYVKHFAPAAILLPTSNEAGLEDAARTSPRFVQPLARSTDAITTIVGLGVGDVANIASDAASGNIAGAVGDAVGGGAVGGSLGKGAAIGAAIGSVIPGVGTAIGGAVGAIIGGIGSLFGGHSGPINFEHLPGDVGHKLVRQIADKIRHAPRWQAHFQAVYRHLPAGTADVRGLNELVARELFPHDVPGKDATTGHPDGLAEWFAQQPDAERLLHGPGVPPGDRHQLEARINAARPRVGLPRPTPHAATSLAPAHAPSPPHALPPHAPATSPSLALTLPFDCHCAPAPRGRS